MKGNETDLVCDGQLEPISSILDVDPISVLFREAIFFPVCADSCNSGQGLGEVGVWRRPQNSVESLGISLGKLKLLVCKARTLVALALARYKAVVRA